MDNNFFNPKGAERERRKNQILMVTVATFALLLLIFSILLCMNVVMAIRDRIGDNDLPDVPDADTPTTPSESEDPDTPDEPSIPDQTFVTLPASAVNEGALVLVNATHVYAFPETNDHLINVSVAQNQAQTKDLYYMIAKNTLLLEQNTYQAMNKMLTAFAEQSGLCDVQLTDAYRSYEQQSSLNSSTTAPGYSDHHTGMTFALNVYKIGGKVYDISTAEEYRWIYDHCYEYGIVARYPVDKSGKTGVPNYGECFRYVGYPHAYAMTAQNMCLEEYVEYLRNYTFDAPLRITPDDTSSYDVYYVAATGNETQIPVPEMSNYTISGDNDRGFIVTVKLS